MRTVTTVRLDHDDLTMLRKAAALLGYSRTQIADPGLFSQPARLAGLANDIDALLGRFQVESDPAWWRAAVNAAHAAAGTGLPVIGPPDPDRFADGMAAQRAADVDTLIAAAAVVAQAVALTSPPEPGH